MANLVETIKVRISPNDIQIEKFKSTQQQFVASCNYASEYIFKHLNDVNFKLKQAPLHEALYYPIREHFNMPSQLANAVIPTVIAKYKTVRTQMGKQPYRFKDTHTGQYYKFKRDISWLQQPIVFSRPVAVFSRNRNYSKKADHHFSIGTLDGRETVEAVLDYEYLDKFKSDDWKFGQAELLEHHGLWFLHISATKGIDTVERSDIKQVVGIDRGLRQVMTTYDSQGRTQFYNGHAIMEKRRKFKKLRQQLQSKGTDSAKRRLQKINQRENRWMNDVNHQLSKALVEHYGPNTLFVLEDLTDVRFATEKFRKDKRYEAVSWSFYDLEQKLIYKAAENYSLVLKVDAHYTSQRCSGCGQINKSSRRSNQHLYDCINCGYKTNDDRNAAKNIQELGKQWISGIKQPKYQLETPKEIYQ